MSLPTHSRKPLMIPGRLYTMSNQQLTHYTLLLSARILHSSIKTMRMESDRIIQSLHLGIDLLAIQTEEIDKVLDALTCEDPLWVEAVLLQKRWENVDRQFELLVMGGRVRERMRKCDEGLERVLQALKRVGKVGRKL